MIIALDYETNKLEYWKPDFRVVSAAFYSPEGAVFLKGEEEVGTKLREFVNRGAQFVVHNAKFEIGVTKFRYGIDLPVHADTMRLAQVYGPPMAQRGDKLVPQFGLGKLANAYLDDKFHDYKDKFHQILKDRGYDDTGSALGELEEEDLEEYNTLDAEVTYRIYDLICSFFRSIDYQWQIDHRLYLVLAEDLAMSAARGVRVHEERLIANTEATRQALADSDAVFFAKYDKEIREIEEAKLTKGWKSEKGREKARLTSDKWRFNLTSTKDKATLFIDKLGAEPRFLTPKDGPSMKASHLPSYGEPGKMVAKRGTTLLNLGQMGNLLQAAQTNQGRWHPGYQLVRTATGRLAGGYGEGIQASVKLNPQGLSRRFKPLMECIVADPGYTIVSIDLSSGEPSCLAHYSKDPRYYAATFGMVGKEPYYDYHKQILMLDDIYLMGASVSPTGRAIIRREYDAGTFEDWLTNAEYIQKKHPVIGPLRADHKGQILGMGYEMGPRKMVKQAWDAGKVLSLEDAKAFHHAYWNELFPEVQKLKGQLQRLFESKGAIVNRFGFRCKPDSPHKCLNYFIQSTVSGIMSFIWGTIRAEAPWILLDGIIHDELVLQVPTDRLDEARRVCLYATQVLNDMLKWDVAIRTGWVTGSNYFEAK